MKPLTVLATFKAHTDKAKELKQALSNLVEPTLYETGCIQYDLHQDINSPEKFFMFEQWSSKEHLDTHLQSDHINEFSKAAEKLLSEPAIISLANKV